MGTKPLLSLKEPAHVTAQRIARTRRVNSGKKVEHRKLSTSYSRPKKQSKYGYFGREWAQGFRRVLIKGIGWVFGMGSKKDFMILTKKTFYAVSPMFNHSEYGLVTFVKTRANAAKRAMRYVVGKGLEYLNIDVSKRMEKQFRTAINFI